MPRVKTIDVKITPIMKQILHQYLKRLPSNRSHYIKYLEGERLTSTQSIKAKCYECCCGYQDGKKDCKIAHCPLYPFMPYRKGNEESENE